MSSDNNEKKDAITHRIREVIDLYPSRTEAAESAGCSYQQLMRYYSGNPIKFDVVARLCQRFSLSLDWVWTGKEPEELFGLQAKKREASPDTDKFENSFVKIPVFDVRVSMGHGSWGDDEQKISDLAFRRDWIRAQGWNPEKLAVVTAVGNSMEGIIESGSPVLVDLSQPTINDAGIYVARLDDHLIIKHMQRDIDGTVYITSNNPAYREIVVSPDRLGDLHIVGRAVWSDRKL